MGMNCCGKTKRRWPMLVLMGVVVAIVLLVIILDVLE